MTNSKDYVEVPIKPNGKKNVQFYDDRVEFDGKSLLYADIEGLSVSSDATRIRYGIIPAGRTFFASVQFHMKDGKKSRININSMSIFGIPVLGNPRKYAELYPALFNAVYSIVAKNMAQKYIDLIRRGTSVEVAGLEINGAEMKSTSKSSKKAVVINQGNYHECNISNDGSVAIYDNQNKLLWASSMWNNKNALLIPHIAGELFGKTEVAV